MDGILRGCLAAEQGGGEEPRGCLEMLGGSGWVQIRAIGGLDTQVCDLDRCQDGLAMEDEAAGRVRCEADDGTEAQRGLEMSPWSHSQWVGEGSLRPSICRGQWLACAVGSPEDW